MPPSVFHVITRLSLGGASEATVSGIEAATAAGYRCVLAVGFAESDPASLEDARRRGCRLVDVPTLGREAAPWRDLGAVRDLARLMRREAPVIVHTHTSKAGFVGRLAARIARVPAVVHQPHGHIFHGYFGPVRTRVYIELERLAARWADRMLMLTELGTVEHLERRIGRPAQFAVVPSGVPVRAFRAASPGRDAARGALGIPRDAFVVAALGRLVPIKGFDLLIEALPPLAAAVPTARLLVIGDGPLRDQFERRAEALGMSPRLTITGARTDVPAVLAAADVLAAPSRNEGMGRAIVEAMALGVPVVGTRVGGIPAVIVDGESGRLVDPENAAALAGALIELALDDRLRAKLGEGAAERSELFSTEVSAARLLAVYSSLTTGAPAS
jgi:glycosyltransferase involved in cell wall biosynthesis